MLLQVAWALSGYAESDTRLGLPHDGTDPFLERARSTIAVRFEATPAENVRAVIDARFLWLVAPVVRTAQDLNDREKLDPFRLEADALFVEVDRLFGAPLRLRAGRQTIRWGSGLLLNPTSTISPPDLEDPLRYGSPMGNEMIRADLGLGPIRLEGIVVPRFRPAFLPEISDRDALDTTGNPIAESIAADPTWTIDIASDARAPDAGLDNVQSALKAAASIPLVDVDLAASWYAGRTPLPQVKDGTLTADFVAQTLTGDVRLVYPRMQVFGLDAAGEIPLGPLGAAGIWFEGAWVVPATMRRTIVANAVTVRTDEFEKPYARIATGLNHTTRGGTVLAAQVLRGFLDEFGAGAQHDFALAAIERTFFREQLRLRLLGAWCLDDDSALAAPEVAWSPADAVTLSLAGYIGIGDDDTKFGRPLMGPPLVVGRARLSF